MGKQKDNIPRATKREQKFKKVKGSFDNCTLSKDDYHKIPGEKRSEYLDKMILKKYNTKVNFKCESCGIAVAFNDSGYITDEDLLNDETISKHFKPK